MKKTTGLCGILLIVFAAIITTSCGSEDENNPSNGTSVIINDDGSTNNGSLFSAIDDKNFYLDYIKYTVNEGHLIVSGYDKVGFSGIAKIVSSITYKGNKYEVLEVGSEAFRYCNMLLSVVLSSSITSIGFRAFDSCKKLTTIELGENLATIGSGSFAGCSSLTTIDFPNSLTTIGSYSFSGCSSLISIKGGNKVEKIYESAFSGTAWLDAQPNGLIYFGTVAYMYKGATVESTITIKEGTTYITSGAFYGVTGLNSIEIPIGITSIGDYAFYGCTDLSSVTIGKDVSFIGEGTFNRCPLTSIRCNSLIPPKLTLDDDVNPFSLSVYSSATLYVPQGTLNDYRSSPGWKKFETVVEF